MYIPKRQEVLNMEINYNVTGPDRKRLVQAIAKILESDAKYLGVPSCAYQVDNFTISKDGILSFDDTPTAARANSLLSAFAKWALKRRSRKSQTGFALNFPLKDTTEAAIDNLRRMVDSKATHQKSILVRTSLEIELTDERIRFPWFDRIPRAGGRQRGCSLYWEKCLLQPRARSA